MAGYLADYNSQDKKGYVQEGDISSGEIWWFDLTWNTHYELFCKA